MAVQLAKLDWRINSGDINTFHRLSVHENRRAHGARQVVEVEEAEFTDAEREGDGVHRSGSINARKISMPWRAAQLGNGRERVS